ncbi:T9SS type A sorting domain-containing protein [Membranihabitans maritimus]|uniref:T9SS type A sorting domain-containing protein n=1 Tax=Membranihabitans maritimus TaxID=2904244 RepID=UPI001F1D26F9|nr:T9SS type A sorting domain-containing protein [Membranihabitans maritimus]
MKKTLLIIYLIPLLTFVCAQSAFSVFPADLTVEIDNVDEFETVAYSYVVNTSEKELNLMWKRNIQSKPDNWGVAICDFNNCWDEIVDSASISLMPGDTSNMDVHIRPNGVDGNAVVKLAIFDLDNRADEFVNSYTFNDATSFVLGQREPQNIRLFPNPTTEYFSVDGVDKLKEVLVVNLVGQEVKRFSASENARYKVSDLMRGLYLVRLVNKEDKIVKTIRLSKR